MVLEIEDIDISRIEDRIIHENYVFGLGFAQSGSATHWIVLRAVAKAKLNYWLYDPVAEGMLKTSIAASTSVDGITNHTYITAQRPGSVNIPSKPSFVFSNEAQPTSRYGYLYQLFFGVSPSYLRLTFEQPARTNQMGLPVQTPGADYNQFGAILARDTRLEQPGPLSEIWVPPALDFALGFINDTPEVANPLMVWVVNYLEYEKVNDPDIVYEVLNTTKYKSLRTVGGTAPFNYSIPNNFGQSPVTLGMTKAQIRAALGV